MKIDPEREKRRSMLIGQVRGLVPEILKRFPAISKIWIIGSAAKPLFFDMRSDIDLVVDGLPKEKYFDLFLFLESGVASKVDVILLGDIKDKDLPIIEQKVVIYEKATV